jgi:hypothetical protein
MPLPPDHIFVKIHDKLDAGYADLLAKLADYEARHHEFQLMHASLSPQERRDFLTDLNAYHRLIETFQRNLFLLSDRFEALLHQVWNDQLQDDLGGLDAALAQLWKDRA